MMINKFSGKFDFLSNFYLCITAIKLFGLTFPTAEHAFQSCKCVLKSDKNRFTDFEMTPSQAKRLGRLVELRSDWELIKDACMLEILRVKFGAGSVLAKKLISTGDATLVEGNTWGDTYWGVCDGIGDNRLGQILMQVRDELQRV